MLPIVFLQHEPDGPPGVIGAALRELGVPFGVRRLDLGEPLPAWPGECSAVISLGGDMHPTQVAEHPFIEAEIDLLRSLLERGAPLWGVCLGAELLVLAAGGEVYEREEEEIGWVSVDKLTDDPLLAGLEDPFLAFDWHTFSFTAAPGGQVIAGRGDDVQALRVADRAWATQFHPEVDAELVGRWLAPYERDGAPFASRLRAEIGRFADGYGAFGRLLTRNFVLTSGIGRAE